MNPDKFQIGARHTRDWSSSVECLLFPDYFEAHCFIVTILKKELISSPGKREPRRLVDRRSFSIESDQFPLELTNRVLDKEKEYCVYFAQKQV